MPACRPRLSNELPRVRGAWRWSAVVLAVRLLLRAGAGDQAASLAYFTVLSFFPLMALMVIVVALFADPSAIRPVLQDLAAYYLPASSNVIGQAVEGLLGNSAPLGLIALAGLVFAGNGLFMAANRSVNRVFGVERHLTLGAMYWKPWSRGAWESSSWRRWAPAPSSRSPWDWWTGIFHRMEIPLLSSTWDWE